MIGDRPANTVRQHFRIRMPILLLYLLNQEVELALSELERFGRLQHVSTTLLRFPWDLIVANGEQIARSIEPFYGKASSEHLFTLLAGHYGAIRDHLDATAASNPALQKTAMQELTANAGEIATFLSGANPYLPKDTLMGLLMAHAAHHITEFQQLQAGDYAKEAETWQGMKQHIYVVADALTGALAKQFPDKF